VFERHPLPLEGGWPEEDHENTKGRKRETEKGLRGEATTRPSTIATTYSDFALSPFRVFVIAYKPFSRLIRYAEA